VIQIYNSTVYGPLSFTGAAPQLVMLVDCRLLNALLQPQTLTIGSSSYYVLQNTIYNESGSALSGTRLL
jgi:hypothetical protein